MKIELGAPVVLWLDDDEQVHTDLVHLPAAEKRVPAGRCYQLDEAAEMPGLRCWPTLCGLTGWIYVYDGVIRDACRERGDSRFCPVCTARAAVVVPLPSRRHSDRGTRRPAAAARDRSADQAAA